MAIQADPRSDDEIVDDVFDAAVQCQAEGAVLDVGRFLEGREHLRDRILEALELARDVAVTRKPVLRTELPGIPGFTLLEEVGRGGMGIVYRARQEAVGRIVALKVLAPSLVNSPRSRERFSVEARALGRVNHENVVAIYDVITTPDVCAFAMEWIDGTTLGRAAAGGRLSADPRAVARIGSAIAHALSAAHAVGLIHRDLKPGNILLRRDGTAVLSDFSLVRDAEQSQHTASGDFLGTVAFAAPEQLRGRNADVGPWTDVYGLGATLYATLAGAPPFGTGSTAALLGRLEASRPRTLSDLDSSVPRDLATVIAKAMDPEVSRRYPTAAAFADDLDRFLRSEPVAARRASLAHRASRFALRRPAAATSIVLGVLLVVGGPIVLYLLERAAARREHDLRVNADALRAAAEASEVKAKADLAVKVQIVEFMRDVFRMGNPMYADGRADMTVREAVDDVSKKLMKRGIAGGPEAEYAIRMSVVETYVAVGLLDAAEQHLAAVAPLQEKLFGGYSQQAADVAQYMARVNREAERFAQAERFQREAIRLRRELLGPESLDLAQALSSLGILCRRTGRLDAALEAYSEALSIYRAGLGDEDENVAIVLGSMATVLIDHRQPIEAETKARQALAMIEKFHHGQPHFDVAHARFNLGTILARSGQDAEGEVAMRDGLAMMRLVTKLPHRRVVDQCGRLAEHLVNAGKFSEAERIVREGYVDATALKTDTLTLDLRLADILLATSRSVEADELMTRVQANRTHALKPEVLRRLAVARLVTGRHADAAVALHHAWEVVGEGHAAHAERCAIARLHLDLVDAFALIDPRPDWGVARAEWRRRLATLEGVE